MAPYLDGCAGSGARALAIEAGVPAIPYNTAAANFGRFPVRRDDGGRASALAGAAENDIFVFEMTDSVGPMTGEWGR